MNCVDEAPHTPYPALDGREWSEWRSLSGEEQFLGGTAGLVGRRDSQGVVTERKIRRLGGYGAQVLQLLAISGFCVTGTRGYFMMMFVEFSVQRTLHRTPGSCGLRADTTSTISDSATLLLYGI